MRISDWSSDVCSSDLLGRLAEAGGGAEVVELVDEVADRRVGGAARGGIRLAALGRAPQLVDRAGLALQLGRPLPELLGLARGVRHHLDLAVTLEGPAFHRLAGLAHALARSAARRGGTAVFNNGT